MANNQIGKQAVEEMVKVFQQYAKVVEEAADANEEFRKTGKMPSGFVEKAQQLSDVFVKLKAAGGEMSAEVRKWVTAQKQLGNVFKREQKELQKTVSLYAQVEKGLDLMRKKYRDLAIRKELNGKLTKSEIVQLGMLEKQIGKYDRALKQVDAGMGKFNRSVGSYGKAFDSLGFSVAQITREAPAFLISMNTGFMAISNNIPILVDELNRLKIANKALAAEGKPTVSVLKQLGGAIFSWQSAISAGIVLLTVLGPKLVEWATGMDEAEKETEEATKALEEQNKELEKNIELRKEQLGTASASVGRTDFFGIAAQSEVRNILDDIQEGRLKGIDAEAQLLLLSERFKKLEIERAELISDQNIDQAKRVRVAEIIFNIAKNENATQEAQLKNQKELTKLREQQLVAIQRGQETAFIDQRIDELNKERQTELFELAKDRIILEAELKSITKDGTAAQEEKIKAQELEKAAIVSLALELRKEIKLLEEAKELYADNSEEVKILEGRIKKLQTALSGLAIDVTNALKAGEQVIDSIVSQSGDDEDNDKLGWKGYFNALVPLAESTFQIINQLQRAATQQALADLQKQRDLAIKFAGDSAEARAAVEEEYNERRAEIQRKQAENEKKNTLFNIILNTAQAVVAALPNIGLSIAVGAVGAAQLALAAAQPIPEFAEGVRDFGGGLAIVGDGGRSEIIRTPDGKVMKTPSKDTLVNLPKGSDVFSSEDEFNRELTRMLNMSMIESNQPLISKPELTKEDLSDVISRLEDTIRNKESIEIIDDERGKRVYKKRLNARTEILNNRRRITGRGV